MRAAALPSGKAESPSRVLRRFGSGAKVVHFLGATKPWQYKYNPQTGSVLEQSCGPVPLHELSFLNQWWATYHRGVLPLYGGVRPQDQRPPPARTVRTALRGGPGGRARSRECGRFARGTRAQRG